MAVVVAAVVEVVVAVVAEAGSSGSGHRGHLGVWVGMESKRMHGSFHGGVRQARAVGMGRMHCGGAGPKRAVPGSLRFTQEAFHRSLCCH